MGGQGGDRMTTMADVPPEVAELFEKFTFQLIAGGRAHYSARAILHRIRWHFHVEKGNREFKCNDHWTPSLARWFMAKYPQYDDFFEIRRLWNDEEDAAA